MCFPYDRYNRDTKVYHHHLEYNGFYFDSSMFNINSKIEITNESTQFENNLVFREFKFDGYNLILIANMDWDEQTDKLYYYRLVATKIQKCRKEAGLHPWDPINAYYNSNPKINNQKFDIGIDGPM